MLKKTSDKDNSSGMIIVIVLALCVCCVFVSVSAAIAMYFSFKKKEAPFDKTLLEYRDKTGSHIIKSLPFDVKDAYYLNMPVSTKRYSFKGKSCLDDVCDDVNLKNVEAINLYYEDGNLLTGKLEYL